MFVIDQARVRPEASSTWEEPAVQFAIALIDGKWTVPILRQLQNGPVRVGELKKRLAPISKKVLNQHLRQMTRGGLVLRTTFGGKVPRVEYSLANPLGCSVLCLLQVIAKWCAQNLPSSNAQKCSARLGRVEIGVETLNAHRPEKTNHRVVSDGAFGVDLCAGGD
jgi:DNA-binding HxlR family transcriptional regulator